MATVPYSPAEHYIKRDRKELRDCSMLPQTGAGGDEASVCHVEPRIPMMAKMMSAGRKYSQTISRTPLGRVRSSLQRSLRQALQFGTDLEVEKEWVSNKHLVLALVVALTSRRAAFEPSAPTELGC